VDVLAADPRHHVGGGGLLAVAGEGGGQEEKREEDEAFSRRSARRPAQTSPTVILRAAKDLGVGRDGTPAQILPCAQDDGGKVHRADLLRRVGKFIAQPLSG